MPSLQEMTTTPSPYYMKDFLASLPDGYQNGQFCALTIDVSYRQNVARIATSILEYVLYRKKSEQYPAIDTYGNQQVHQLGKHLDARTISVNAFIIYKQTSTRRTKKWYTQKDFREELFKEMIAGYRQWKRNTMEGTLNQ
ncbi:hypothetical protein MAR_019988 [Mya arenaria]|uniref:Uncharacterized protein n=1 Tax=Mya arenaria TaxID=6604 RepID=A0ABY7E617_MYAAR|nr:hypothetical protein MAR_019988 [Mya arenaria]